MSSSTNIVSMDTRPVCLHSTMFTTTSLFSFLKRALFSEFYYNCFWNFISFQLTYFIKFLRKETQACENFLKIVSPKQIGEIREIERKTLVWHSSCYGNCMLYKLLLQGMKKGLLVTKITSLLVKVLEIYFTLTTDTIQWCHERKKYFRLTKSITLLLIAVRKTNNYRCFIKITQVKNIT